MMLQQQAKIAQQSQQQLERERALRMQQLQAVERLQQSIPAAVTADMTQPKGLAQQKSRSQRYAERRAAYFRHKVATEEQRDSSGNDDLSELQLLVKAKLAASQE